MSKILERYIQEVLEFKARQKQILQEKELREIGQELGMSAEDWKALQQNFQDHLYKGKSFAQYKNWEDAITELEIAESLHPYNIEVLTHLAEAYKERWKLNASAKDKKRAEVLARRLLEVEPTNQTAIRLISFLRQHQFHKSEGKTTKNKANQMWAYMLPIGLLCLGLLFFFLFKAKDNRDKDPRYQIEQIDPKTPISTKPQKNTDTNIGQQDLVDYAPAEQTLNKNTRGDKKEGRLNIDFMETEASKEIQGVEVDFAEASNYQDAYSAKFKGYIYPISVDVSGLKMEASIIDEQGNVIETEYEEVVDYESGDLQWHSDAIPFDFHFFKKMPNPPVIKEIRYKISDIKTQAIPKREEWKKAEKLVWSNKPSEWDLFVEIRKKNVTSVEFLGKVFFRYNIGVKNTGTAPIRNLKLRFRFLGQKGQELETNDWYIVSNDDPPLLPGMAYNKETSNGVEVKSEEEVKDFEIEVIQIE